MTNDEFSNTTRCDEIMLQVSELLEELASLQPPELAEVIPKPKQPKKMAFTAVENKSRSKVRKTIESYKIPEDIAQKLIQQYRQENGITDYTIINDYKG